MKLQPLKVGDFSENHENPWEFFAEIHGVEPKTVSIHLNPDQNLKNDKKFFWLKFLGFDDTTLSFRN